MLCVAGERLAGDSCTIGRLLRLNRLVQAAERGAVVPCVCNPQAQAGRTVIGTWGGGVKPTGNNVCAPPAGWGQKVQACRFFGPGAGKGDSSLARGCCCLVG